MLPALQEGGLVQLAFPETLVAEIPLIIATDTILEGVVAGGRLATLSGGGARRVFHVLPGVRFEIRNCVVREGLSTNGGGIYNEGTLIASNVVFAACKANGTDGVAGAAGESRFGVGGNGGSGGAGAHGLGGALFNAGNASLVDCILNGNSAQGGKGGKGGDGGTGTWANGVGGSGGSGGVAHGGAIHGIPGSVLIVTNTLFTSNTATAGEGGAGGSASAGPGSGQGGPGASAAGGAIHSEGFLRVVRSAFATNAVVGGTSAAAGAPSGNVGRDGAGGGHAWGGALSSWSTGAVLNSTFVTNRVAGGNGGNGATGSFTSGDGGDGGDGLGGAVYGKGQLGLTNVTIAWNVVTNGLGGTGGSTLGGQAGSNGRAAGSGVAVGGGVVTLANALVVEANGRGTIHGGATDAGHNLFSDGGTGRKVPGSIYSANPLFSEYKVWVNLTTPGFLLQPGSPAIDAGDPETSLSEDQRGLPRPSGLGPDIGSMEVATTNFVIGGVVWANEEEKRGVPGVVLEVADKSTTTDANGRFRFPPMPSGFYTVAIAGGGVGFTPRLIQLSLSADTTNLVFRTIATVVTYVPDAEQVGVGSIVGTGVAGRTYRLESSSDLRAWSFVARATSNAQGRVVFRHDTAGADRMFYRLAAE
ncbi:MAG: carboxypeptidase regulatory-like domain-containing protein [Verrucomicrobiales bacterium]|nr:carboxypeptidase regulatory-like domain-containing protein [Verrucomicrobiales bacterium]